MEEWRAIQGFEGSYEVSSLGEVRSLDRVLPHARFGTRKYRGQPLKKLLDTDGYFVVNLSEPGKYRKAKIHILVCETFIGPSPKEGLWVLHGDGNNQNNIPSNLRWGTPKENQLDALKHGTHSNIKLDFEKVLRIRELIGMGLNNLQIAEMFDIHNSVISRIRTGDSWTI